MQTNAYGIGECSDVSNTIPMLVPYYHSIGLYATNGSDNSNNNSSDDNESNDTSDEARHCSEASGNSNLSEDEDYATPIIDARYFIVASISDVEPSEEISTNPELWSTSYISSSSPSLYTTTSQYSEEPLPSFAHLLDYSPFLSTSFFNNVKLI